MPLSRRTCAIASDDSDLLPEGWQLDSDSMQLTVREAATHLGVNEVTVRRWIDERALPAHRVDERLYFNPIELWEWAVANGIAVSRGLLEQARRSPDEVPPLADLRRE